jgi:hypothetical protein
MNNYGPSKERNNILKSGSKNLNSENWKVFNPDGRHMFTCGEKKANWYLDRDLAVMVGFNEIKFTFDPRGNGFEDNEIFGRNMREPICVVSGLDTGLQRHHIVPYCYRTYFPVRYKSKNHHDVVLINHKHHSDYEVEATKFKDEIAKIYGVKTIGELNIEYTGVLREIGKKNGILLNMLHSIFRSYGKASPEITIDKLKFVSVETGIPFETMITYNYVQLYKLYLLIKEVHTHETDEFKAANRMHYDHGYHVAQKLDTEEKIEEFVKLWRNHFINTMNPEYMPDGWSIDFRIKTKM